MATDRPPLCAIAPSLSSEEAAAIVAAIERFTRATAPPASSVPAPPDAWHTTAILEGVSRDPWAGVHHPWVDTAHSLP